MVQRSPRASAVYPTMKAVVPSPHPALGPERQQRQNMRSAREERRARQDGRVTKRVRAAWRKRGLPALKSMEVRMRAPSRRTKQGGGGHDREAL